MERAIAKILTFILLRIHGYMKPWSLFSNGFPDKVNISETIWRSFILILKSKNVFIYYRFLTFDGRCKIIFLGRETLQFA